MLFPATTPAVCVPPGARLLLRDIPVHLQWQLKVSKVEEVTFTQLSAEAYRYRDAVRFKNGREILVQLLQCGQRVHVLSVESLEGGDEAEETRERRIEGAESDEWVEPDSEQ